MGILFQKTLPETQIKLSKKPQKIPKKHEQFVKKFSYVTSTKQFYKSLNMKASISRQPSYITTTLFPENL